VIKQNQVYINGQFVDAITAERIDVIDPATSDVTHECRMPTRARHVSGLGARFLYDFVDATLCGG